MNQFVKRYVYIVIIAGFTFTVNGCCNTSYVRAIGVPAAASRTPDLPLPLTTEGEKQALLVLDGYQPPRGHWEAWDPEEQDEIIIDQETKAMFSAILGELKAGENPPASSDLNEGGRIGRFFEGDGAHSEALDARLFGEILTRDIRAGLLHGYWFLFYRRYPADSGTDGVCAENAYCRCVIVKETATREE